MKRIGIIGAMDLEVEHLKGEMQISRIVDKAGMEFYTGTLKGVDVVIVRSGIGKVNAGLCAQILADVFQVTHIINTGVAGSLNAKLDIGDILIPGMHYIMTWMSEFSAISWAKFPRWAAVNSRLTKP